MISSGIKRGVATFAISALAVAGLPLLAGTASAVPLSDQAGGANAVRLANPEPFASNNISSKNDGQNSTFRLQAVAGANIDNVRFEYSLNGGTTWIAIATVGRNDNGSFSHEWDLSGVAGGSVTNRAVGIDTSTDPATEFASAVSTNTVDNTLKTTNVNNGETIGVFQQPYTIESQTGNWVITSGTSSDPSQVYSYWWDNSAGTGYQSESSTATTASGGTNVWTDSMDITGYPFGTGDQLLVAAENGTPSDGSGDAEAFALYKQAITTVTATADRTNVPAGERAIVTVTVKDQNGLPIRGAQVFSSGNDGPVYTDKFGQAVFTGATNGQAAGTEYYYANATDGNAYEPELGDKRSADITVTQYNPVPTSLDADSRDGAAFDIDEYEDGDITVQVLDQNGQPRDTTGQTLNYHWNFTPFGGGAVQRFPLTGEAPQPAETGGKFVVPLPPLGSGTYELVAGLSADGGGNNAIAPSSLLTVKSGQASWTFDEAEPEQAPIGGDEVVGATLALEDGTGLPSRPAQFSRATAGNSAFNQATGPDAATFNTVTDASGRASATLDDPNSDTTPETADVTVATTNWTHDTDTDNAGATSSAQEVRFIANVTPASVVITDDSGPDSERPGELAAYHVTVMSGDQDSVTPGVQSVPLTNQSVTITTDHGYFTDGVPQGSVGGDAGVYDNDGQSITVTTDGAGMADFTMSIGRNAGFDDDGLVTSNITATAGPASDTEDQQWNSADPLNGGAVQLVFSPDAQQQSGVLPQAPVDDEVLLDVLVTDQFGNAVGGETVAISDNTGLATATPASVVSDFVLDGDVEANADSAVDQIITATWVTDTEVLVADGADAGTAPDTADGPDETLTGSRTVQWYEVDFANSLFDLDHTGPDTVPVGTTVTMVYTATDQFGEPISDLYVSFFRSGPDDLQDGSGSFNGFLGQDGQIQYVFAGTKEGTAIVTAIGRDGGPAENVVPQSEQTDSVSFGPTGGRTAIVAKLKGRNTGVETDKLKVVTIPRGVADGARVNLFRFNKNGVRVLVESSQLNANGIKRFQVADLNGRKYTKYVAKVRRTADSKADLTNTKRVR